MQHEAVQRFYKLHAHIYDHTRWLILHSRAEAVEALQLKPDSTVMEIGCGTGLNFDLIQKQLDPDHGRLIGLDYSIDMLKRARRRVSKKGWRNVDLIHADAGMPAVTECLDAVLFGYSIAMIPEWQASLKRACESVKPGGRVGVLEFSTFDGWGPFGAIMRTWLRANHVHTKRPYLSAFRELFPEAYIRQWLGGYNFIAVGVRR